MLQRTMVNLYICNSSNPGGEIGRRTSLRGWRLYGRGSSNLLLGTLPEFRFLILAPVFLFPIDFRVIKMINLLSFEAPQQLPTLRFALEKVQFSSD